MNISAEQAFNKLRHYCSYQERSHKEVKEKLYGYKLHKADVETLLARLIEEGYLNEERFARQFAGGKFRMKGWGKVKISYELSQKGVSSYNIRKALDEIETGDYYTKLKKLAAAKWKLMKNEPSLSRQAKTYKYLLQKGYEGALVKKALSELSRD